MPTVLNSAPMSPRGSRVELAEHGLQAAVHVDAVVGIADRRVELGQVRPCARRSWRRTPAPTRRRRRTATLNRPPPRAVRVTVAGQAPQRSPAVLTGASHSFVKSSFSFSSVIEQPAISSDVM